VITIALALVATLGILLARPAPSTVITVVVPQAQAAAPTTVVSVPASWPYYWGYCGARACWRD
jgi:hypothetical protein